MFGSSESPNPLDAPVLKATDESLVSDNWEYIIDVCDTVNDDPDNGPQNALKAIKKRLAINNANILLRSLSLILSLAENCGSKMKQEISSSEFTSVLYGLVENRAIHYSIKVRLIEIMGQLSQSFKSDPSLKNLEKTYARIKNDYPNLVPSGAGAGIDNGPAVPNKDRMSETELRNEEEELQAVLKLSLDEYNTAEEVKNSWKNSVGPSANLTGTTTTTNNNNNNNNNNTAAASVPAAAPASAQQQQQQQLISLTAPGQQASSFGVLQPNPAQAINPQHTALQPQFTALQPQQQQQLPIGQTEPTTSVADIKKTDKQTAAMVNKVMALYDLTSSEPDELSFKKGDTITVLESVYKDWWRGSLHGKVGIFPLNYVTPIKEPTREELLKDIEIEYNITQQTKNIERLLVKLQALNSSDDPSEVLSASNDEYIQSLYNNITPLRPQVAKLIEKYSKKKEDLISLDGKLTDAEKKYNDLMDAAISKYKQPAFAAHPPVVPQGFAQQQQHHPNNPYALPQQQQHQPQYGQAPLSTGVGGPLSTGGPLHNYATGQQQQQHSQISSFNPSLTGYNPQQQQQQQQPQHTQQQHTGYNPYSNVKPQEPLPTGLGFGNAPLTSSGLPNINLSNLTGGPNTNSNNNNSSINHSQGNQQQGNKITPPYPISDPLQLPSLISPTKTSGGPNGSSGPSGPSGGAGPGTGSSPFPKNSNVFLPKPPV